MADHNNIIITFQKGSSAEDRSKLLDDLKGKGAQVVKDENLSSPIMPFVVVSMPDEHYESLQSDSLQGHSVVKHVGNTGSTSAPSEEGRLVYIEVAEAEWQEYIDFKGRTVPQGVFEKMREIKGISGEPEARGVEVGDESWAVLTDWVECN